MRVFSSVCLTIVSFFSSHPNQNGETALSEAAKEGHVAVVKLLLDKEIDCGAADKVSSCSLTRVTDLILTIMLIIIFFEIRNSIRKLLWELF